MDSRGVYVVVRGLMPGLIKDRLVSCCWISVYPKLYFSTTAFYRLGEHIDAKIRLCDNIDAAKIYYEKKLSTGRVKKLQGKGW